MEQIEQVLKSKIVNLDFRSKEFKVKNKRKTYNLDGYGYKSFITENIPLIKSTFNGSSDSIIATISKKESQIEEAINSYLSKIENKAPSSFVKYSQSIVKLTFSQEPKESRHKVFNNVTNCIDEHYNLDAIKSQFLCHYGKDLGEDRYNDWQTRTEKYCVFGFYQNKPRIIPVDPSLKKYIFNNYLTPKYRSHEGDQPNVEDVQHFKDYLRHLFPDDTQREYCLAWVYTSLISRQETFLTLIGNHGVGKTLFMNLVSNLHGLENTVRPKEINTRFNGYLGAKSIVLYDEVSMNLSEKETFKRIANPFIQVEQKGRDQKDIENKASIILASNYASNISIEPSDRRFSVPDLGKEKLEKKLGAKVASRLFEIIEDDSFLKYFYNLLMKKFKDDSRLIASGSLGKTVPLKDTKMFEDCCRVNAPYEVKYVINKLKETTMSGDLAHPIINFKEIVMEYKADNEHRKPRIKRSSIFFSRDIFFYEIAKYRLNGKPLLSKDPEDKDRFINGVEIE